MSCGSTRELTVEEAAYNRGSDEGFNSGYDIGKADAQEVAQETIDNLLAQIDDLQAEVSRLLMPWTQTQTQPTVDL